MSGTVRVERDGAVGWVVLDHPERRNALTAVMFGQLADGLAELDADAAVRVIVLRGAGDRAFASGADIGDLGAVGGSPGSPRVGAAKPVIAMIHGVCMGGGLLVALGADIRAAADDARFAIPAVRLGAAYPYDGVRRLVTTVGPAAAGEILLTGATFGAADALRWGLVSRVVPAGELEATVVGLAGAITAGAPLSVAAAAASVRAAVGGSDPDDVERAHAAIAACWASEDLVEGRAAFAQKRAPRFRGR